MTDRRRCWRVIHSTTGEILFAGTCREVFTNQDYARLEAWDANR